MSHILPLAFGIGAAGLLVVGITAAIVKGTLRVPFISPSDKKTAPYDWYTRTGTGAATGAGNAEATGVAAGSRDLGGLWKTPYSPTGPGAGFPGSGLDAPAPSPLAPSNLALSNVGLTSDGGRGSSSGSGMLSWTPPLAGQPAGYTIFKDGEPIGTVPGDRTEYPLSGLPTNGEYTKLQLVPFDGNGVSGPPSHTLAAALPSDPSNGIALTSQPMGPGPSSSGHLAWRTPSTGAAGGAGIGGYAIFRDGQQIGTVKPPSPISTRGAVNSFVVRNPGLVPGEETLFSVAPISPSGEVIGAISNKAPLSAYPVGSGAGPNASQPSMAPTGLQLTGAAGMSIFGSPGKLSWNPPSSGNPAKYAIVSDGEISGTVSGSATSADAPRGGRVYQVLPIDRFGNVGPPSLPVSNDPGMGAPGPYHPATGPGAGIAGSGVDAPAPSPLAPSSLALSSFNGSGSGSAILSWRPPQNGTPSSYTVLKNGSPIGFVPGSQNSIQVSDLPTDGSPSTLQVVPFDEKGYAGPSSSPLAATLPRDPTTGIALTSTPTGNASNPSALLSWTTPAGDLRSGAGGPPGYAVMQDGRQIGTVKPSPSGINSFIVKNLPSGTSVDREPLFTVAPISPAGDIIGSASGTVPLLSYPLSSGAGTAPQTAMMPSGVQLTSSPGLFSSSGRLSWNPPAAGYPASYAVTENGRVVGTVPANQTAYEVSPKPGSVYQVLPIDRFGSSGPASQPVVSGSDPSGASSSATPLSPGAGIAGSGIRAQAPHPLAPSNLALSSFNGSGPGSATLSWSHPDVGVPASYTIFKGGFPIASVPGNQTSLPVSALPNSGGATSLQVVPFDSNGVVGPASAPLSATLPSDPRTGMVLTSTVSGPETIASRSAILSWTTPSTSGDLASFAVLKDGVKVASVEPSPSGVNGLLNQGVLPSSSAAHSASLFSIVALNPNGVPIGQSSNSVPLTSYPAGSGAGPASPADMAPSNLQLTTSPGLFGSSGRLSWSRPRAGSPASYAVIGDGKVLGTVPASQTSFDVSPRSGEPGSVYQVAPLDRYGNVGPATRPVSSAGPAPGPYSGAGNGAPFDSTSPYALSSGPGAGIAGSGVDAPAPSPLAPSSLALSSFTGSGSGSGSATLSWKRPASGSPASYTVLQDGKPVASVAGNQTSAPLSGLPTNGGASTLQVVPFDSNGVAGPVSSPLAASLPSDPSSGIALTSTPAGSGSSPSALLAWTSPSGLGNVASFGVLQDGRQVATVKASPSGVTTFAPKGLSPSAAANSYFSVVPLSSSGSPAGPPSNSVPLASYPAGSGAGPASPADMAPSNLQLTTSPGLFGSSGRLSWSRPRAGSPASYAVIGDGKVLGTVPASQTSFDVSPRSGEPGSVYQVAPVAANGALGPASNPASSSSGPAPAYSGASAPGFVGAGAGPYGPASGPGAGIAGSGVDAPAPSPLAPSSLALSSFTGSGSGSGSATLSWKRPASGSPASYTVLQDGKPVASVAGNQTSAPLSGLPTNGGASTLQVVPFDSNGVAGPVSSPLAASLPSDPSSGIALTSTPAGSGSSPSALLSWTSPSGLGNVASFGVLQDGRQVATVKASPSGVTTFAPKGLSPSAAANSYFSVVPLSSSGSPAGPPSNSVPLASYPAGSGAGPASPADMAPSNLQLTTSPGFFGSSGRLSWSRPRAGSPASYAVIGDGKVLGTVPASQTSFDVSPRSGEPGSVYQVAPVAANGALGPASNPASSSSGPAPAYSGASAPGFVGAGAGPYGPASGPGAGIAGSGVDAPAPSPLAPSSLALSSFTGSGSGSGSATLSWKRPASGSPASYTVLQDGKPVASVAGNQTSAPLSGLPTNGGASTLQVVPFDSNGVAGPASSPLAASLPSDPSSGIALTSTPAGSGSSPSALLSWTSPSGLGNVASFGVLQDGRQGLSPSAAANSYFSVVPLSSSGSPAGPPSNSVPLASYPAGSGAGPASPADMAPSNLQLTTSPGFFGSSGRLSWSRPRAGSPASYAVIGDGKVLGTVPASQTSFDVSPRSGEPGSVYQVAPVAANGALGPASNPASSSSGPAPAYSGASAPGFVGAGAGPYGPASGPGAGIAGSGVDAPAPSPLAPSSLALSSFTGSGSGSGSATLSWKRPASGSPASYTVLQDGKPVASVAGNQTSAPLSGLPTNGGASTLQVVPFDSNGVAGPASSPLAASLPSDPSSGIALTSTPAGSGSSPSALLAWTSPSGLGNVASFGVLQDGRQVATVKASPSGVTTFAPKGLSPSAAANSNSVPLASYPAGSGAGPASPADMAPSNLQLTTSPGLFGSSGRLSWSRPRAGSPASYAVIGDGKVLGTVPASQTSFDVSPRSGEPGSVYQVAPVAANGALGPASNPVGSGSGSGFGTGPYAGVGAAALSGAGYGGAASGSDGLYATAAGPRSGPSGRATSPSPAPAGLSSGSFVPSGPSSPGAGIAGSGVDAPAPSPLAPSSLALSSFTGSGSGSGSATLSWKRPASGSPASYTVLQDGKPVASVAGNQTSAPLSGLPTNGGASTLQVVPFDSNGVAGPASSPLAASLPSDPSSGIALTSTPAGSGSSPSALLAWTSPSGLGNVASFGVLQDGRQVATVKASPSGVTTFAPKGLSPSAAANSYFSVVPLSSSGSPAGPPSNSVPLASYPAGSGAGPASPADMAPSNLQLTTSPGLFGSSGRLSWSRPRAGSPQATRVYQVAPVAANGALGPASNPASSGSGPAPAYSGASAPGFVGAGAGPYGPASGPGAGIAGSGVDAPAPSPLAPSSLALSSFTGSGSGSGSATLSWKRPASGSPASYTVLQDGKPVASVAGNQTSAPLSGLPTNGGASTLQVVPFDSNGVAGPVSSPLAASLPSDPSSGIALTSTPAGSGSSPSALLAWTSPSGLGNVASFGVLQDGRQVATVKASPSGVTTFAPKGLSPSAAANSYFSVVPLSSSGSPAGPPSNSVPLASYPAGSGAGPASPADMAPSNLQLTTSPGLFGSYAVIGDGKVLGTVPASQTSFDVSPRSGEPGSVYQVAPVAANGALGPASNPVGSGSGSSFGTGPYAGVGAAALSGAGYGGAASGSDGLYATAAGPRSGPSGRATSRSPAPAGLSSGSFVPSGPSSPGAGIAGSGVDAPAPSPLAPSSLALSSFTGSGSGSGSATLSWKRPASGSPASYTVLQDGKPVASVAGNQTSAPLSGLPTNGGASTLQVVPFDSNGVAGPASSPLAASLPSDPSSGIALTSTPAGSGSSPSALLAWSSPSGLGNVASFGVLQDGRQVATVKASPSGVTTFAPKGLSPSAAANSYFSVVPLSSSGSPAGPPSNSVPLASYPAGSGAGPASPADMAPSNLQLTTSPGLFGSSGRLSWSRPRAGSPASYAVIGDGKVLGTVPASQTSFDVSPRSGEPGSVYQRAWLCWRCPLAPSNLALSSFTGSGSGSGSATLSWKRPASGSPASYTVLQDGKPVASVAGNQTSAPLSGLPTNGGASTLQVVPFDSNGVAGPVSSPLAASLPSDPSSGIALTSTPAGSGSSPSALLAWTSPSGLGNVASFGVLQDGRQVATVKASPSGVTTFAPKGLSPSAAANSYFSVVPLSSSGSPAGPPSNSVPLASYPAGSGAGPASPADMAPSNLQLTTSPGLFGSSGRLSWSRPRACSPASYAVIGDGKVLGTVPASQTSFDVSPRSGEPGSVYQVAPVAANGALGPASNPVGSGSGSGFGTGPYAGVGAAALSGAGYGGAASGSDGLYATAAGPRSGPSGRATSPSPAPAGLSSGSFVPSGPSSPARASPAPAWTPRPQPARPVEPRLSSFTGSGSGSGSATLSWKRPASGSPASYTVLQDGKPVASVAGNQTSAPLSGLPTNGGASTLQVVPFDSNGVAGPASSPLAASLPSDPSSSIALTSTPAGSGSSPSALLAWTSPSGLGNVASFGVLQDGRQVATVKASPSGVTTFAPKGLSPSAAANSYFSVVPLSSSGSPAGPPSNSVPLASYPAGSGAGPASPADMAPSNLQLTTSPGLFGSSGRLSWSRPRAGSPASYAVIGDGKVLGTVPASQTSFDVSPRSGEPGSVYQVAPVAANGALGPASNPVGSGSGSSFGTGPYAGVGAAALSGAGYGGAASGSDGLYATAAGPRSGPSGRATSPSPAPAGLSSGSFVPSGPSSPGAGIAGSGVDAPAPSPLAPSSLALSSFTGSGSGSGSATLSWKRPASGSPASYTVLQDGKPVASVAGNQTSAPLSGLPTNGGASTLQVVPFDSNGVAGPVSSPLAASLPSDPSSGIALTSTPAGSGSSPSALLAWSSPSGLGNVASFGVLQDGRQVATVKASPSGVTTFAPKGLSPSAAANSNSVPLASYPAGSGAGPASPADMAPSNLQLTTSPGLFGSSGRLSWSRPRAGSPASYAVIGDGKVLGTVPASQTSFDVSPRSGEPGSVYQVAPVAANGALGPASNPASSGSGPAPAYSGASAPGFVGAGAGPYGPTSGPGAGIAGSGVDAPAPSPLAPSSLALSSFTGSGSGSGSATLSWKRPASGSPASYTVLQDGKPVASVAGNQTSAPLSGLPTNGGASTLQVVPFDSNGVAGPVSSPLAASLPSDPSSGIALTSTPAGSGSSPSALLAWTSPSGLGNVASFGVLQDGRQVATVKASPSGVTTFAPKGLSPSAAANSYFSVVPLSSSGSPAGPPSNSVPLASYPAGSGAGPASPADMAPSNLQLTTLPGLFGSSGRLSWSRPRAGSPASYAVIGDGKVLGTVPASQTSFDVSPRSGEPGSVYQVAPVAANGALGPASNPVGSGSGSSFGTGPYAGVGAAALSGAGYGGAASGSDGLFVPSGPSSPGAGIAGSGVDAPAPSPLAPSSLALSSFTGSGSGSGSATLSWQRPASGSPASYTVLQDGKPVASVAGNQTSAPLSGLPANGGASTLQVVPFDSNGVAGPVSSPLAASLPSDPSSGIALTSTPAGSGSSPSALLAWTSPSGLATSRGAGRAIRARFAVVRGADAISRGSFGVLQDGRQVATVKASPSGVTTFAPKGLSPSAAANSYFSVVPLSSSGSPAGPPSNSVPLASYPAGSGAGPASPADMAPSNLQLTTSPGLFGSSGRLSWSRPRAGSPASYAVIGDGKVLGTVPASQTSFDVSPRSGEPGSVYQVAPVAANGALGPASNPASSGSGPAPAYSGASAPGFVGAGAGPPLAPSSLALSSFTGSGSGSGSATLSWKRPASGSPASYTVLQDGKPVASVAGNQTSAPLSGLPTNGGASTLQVVPFDSNGVAGPVSSPLAASLPSDPSSGIALTSTPAGSGSSPSALLAWTSPSGLGNVASFGVLQDGRQVATVKASPSGVTTFAPKGLSPSAAANSYFSVVPLSSSGSPAGPPSNSVPLASYPAGSGAGPASPADMAPSNLQLTTSPGLFGSSGRLSWSRPRAGSPASYAVIGDGKVLGTVPASQTSFDVSPRSGEPGSVYQVAPVAANGALGPASNPASSGSALRPPTAALARLALLALVPARTAPLPAPARASPAPAWTPPPPARSPRRASPQQLHRQRLRLRLRHPLVEASASGSPASYTVLQDGKPVASVAGNQTSAPLSGLPTNGGASTLQVVPFDSNGVAGPVSSPLAASLPSDPSSGIALTSTPAGSGSSPSALLAWTSPSGLGNVASFGVLQDGRQVATVKASPSGVTTFAPKGLSPSAAANSYFSVVPLSSSGSPAGPEQQRAAGLLPGRLRRGPASPADMAPSNLQLTTSPGLFGSSGRLSWSRPRAGSPASYAVIGDGKVLGTVPASQTSFDVSPRSGEPGSVYQVAPVAANGALGPASNPVSSGSGSGFGTGPYAGVGAAALSGAGYGGAASGSDGLYATAAGPRSGPSGRATSTSPAAGAFASSTDPYAVPSAASLAAVGASGAAPDEKAPSNLRLTSTSAGGRGGSSALSWSHPARGPANTYAVMANGKVITVVPGTQTTVLVPAAIPGSTTKYQVFEIFFPYLPDPVCCQADFFLLKVVPMGPSGAAETASFQLAASAPSDPSSALQLSAAPSSASSATLKWNRPTGKAFSAGRLQGYNVIVNGATVASVAPTVTEYEIADLPPSPVVSPRPEPAPAAPEGLRREARRRDAADAASSRQARPCSPTRAPRPPAASPPQEPAPGRPRGPQARGHDAATPLTPPAHAKPARARAGPPRGPQARGHDAATPLTPPAHAKPARARAGPPPRASGAKDDVATPPTPPAHAKPARARARRRDAADAASSRQARPCSPTRDAAAAGLSAWVEARRAAARLAARAGLGGRGGLPHGAGRGGRQRGSPHGAGARRARRGSLSGAKARGCGAPRRTWRSGPRRGSPHGAEARRVAAGSRHGAGRGGGGGARRTGRRLGGWRRGSPHGAGAAGAAELAARSGGSAGGGAARRTGGARRAAARLAERAEARRVAARLAARGARGGARQAAAGLAAAARTGGGAAGGGGARRTGRGRGGRGQG
eukprot:tig00001406_g8590.t1